MRKFLLVAAAWLSALMMMARTPAGDRVEVMYFHGKQRCVTCLAIEKLAREVVETDFAQERKAGKVVWKVVDISTPAGQQLAKTYRVTWSSLLVNAWKDGKEKRSDLTRFAFKNARNRPSELKRGLSEKIREQLK